MSLSFSAIMSEISHKGTKGGPSHTRKERRARVDARAARGGLPPLADVGTPDVGAPDDSRNRFSGHHLLRRPLVQPLTDGFGLDVRGEAVLVFLLSYILQYVFIFLTGIENSHLFFAVLPALVSDLLCRIMKLHLDFVPLCDISLIMAEKDTGFYLVIPLF